MRKNILLLCMIACIPQWLLAMNEYKFDNKIHQYVMTWEELIVDAEKSVTVEGDGIGMVWWRLYVDMEETTERALVYESLGTSATVSASCLDGVYSQCKRYGCEGDNSVYYKGTLLKITEKDMQVSVDSTIILFNLLPAKPEISAILMDEEWDYEYCGFCKTRDNVVLNVSAPNANRIGIYQFFAYIIDFYYNYIWYINLAPEDKYMYSVTLSHDVEDGIQVFGCNKYGKVISDPLYIEDLITDPDVRASWEKYKEDWETSVHAPRAARSKDKTSPSGIYDLQGRRLQQPPSHGMYIQDGRKVVR